MYAWKKRTKFRRLYPTFVDPNLWKDRKQIKKLDFRKEFLSF